MGSKDQWTALGEKTARWTERRTGFGYHDFGGKDQARVMRDEEAGQEIGRFSRSNFPFQFSFLPALSALLIARWDLQMLCRETILFQAFP